MGKLFFNNALLPEGWASGVEIQVDDEGRIASVATGKRSGGPADGAIAVPGLCNLHSHAFQRAMAGLGERRGASGADDFWSWREVMYRFVEKLTPEDNRAIAAQLYVEMLEAGFTSVGEFHYVHHQPGGATYDDPSAMADAILAAARETGIALTLLPVLYAQGGFDGKPLSNAQSRFRHDAESFLSLIDACKEKAAKQKDVVVGAAPHSLRAVPPEMLSAVVEKMSDGPIHIHIAEQTKEVEDCLAWSGARPVQWLLDHHQVDGRWCLVHATHMSDEETKRLAATGAVAGICPTTEANLGDGIFNGPDYLAANGAWGVGTDSHVRVDAAEELRLFETSQRLRDRRRLCLVGEGQSNGRVLFEGAAKGGAQALKRDAGRIEAGAHCDIVALNAKHPLLIGKTGDQWLDSWIFAGDRTCVENVWVGGRHLVRGGAHFEREDARRGFDAAMKRLTAGE